MAEIATIARPYAEALFKAAGADAAALKDQVSALAQLASDEQLRQFADDPKVVPAQVFDLVAGIALQKGVSLDAKVGNLLRTVIDNGRLAVLPEVAKRFRELANAQGGRSDAQIYSAFPIEGSELAQLKAVLEKRFGRQLEAQVHIAPELIGGVRVVVGDEVLDTSVRARLQQMKAALTA